MLNAAREPVKLIAVAYDRPGDTPAPAPYRAVVKAGPNAFQA